MDQLIYMYIMYNIYIYIYIYNIYIYIYIYHIYMKYMKYIIYICICVDRYINDHKWSTTHRVLKSHRSKMDIMCIMCPSAWVARKPLWW